jgi:TolB-like protein/DNA-binding winged helix-turn-helix (wHTH) protein/Tfp pilus assembly protein PilF
MTKRVKHFYEFGPFRLDLGEQTLLCEGRPVALRPKVFDILRVLVENHGHLVDKEELMRSVWTEQFVEEGNLNKNVSMLRQALGEGQNGHTFIETVPKRGYRFIADVREVNGGEETDLAETNLSTHLVAESLATEATNVRNYGLAATEPEPTFQQSQKTTELTDAWTGADNTKGRSTSFRLLFLALAALLLVALLYVAFIREKRVSPTPTIASIVVLPLENLSGDPSQEYFADGMTDALIGDLAKIGELRVISRTSSIHYKGTKISLPDIARELNVDAVVEGTVQRSGDRVRIRVQLIHAATDAHLWVETYERDVRNVLELQSEIAQAIARKVQIKTTPAEQARLTPRPPVNLSAFDDYLQGRYLYYNKRTEENLLKALEYFQSAIRKDPSYALAYVGLADSYNALGSVQIGSLPPLEARQHAEEAAGRALELDAGLAEAHVALGSVHHFNWNWAAAEQEFKLAIELNPNYANAHTTYAGFLMSKGRVEESIAASNRARELDPFSLSISAHRGFLLENARRYDEAIEQLRRVIAMDQNHYQAHWFLGHTYAANGQFDEAVAASEKAVSLSARTPGALGVLGLVYGLAGRKGEAIKVLNELLALNKRRYVTPAALANVYIGLGDKDQAFAWLDKACQERSNYVAYLKVFPIVDPLRSDPRFDELLRRTGLDSELR